MDEWAKRRRAIEDSRYWINRAGRYGRWRKLPFRAVITVLNSLLRMTPIYARGRRNALDLQRVELELDLPGLPVAFDGYRILHVSDTHLDHLPELAGAARDLLRDIEVDLLALTGDVHGHERNAIEVSTELLMQALAEVRVRGPRLAVLGNHDPADMVGLLERAGFDVLVNRSVVIARAGESLRVTGLDDVHSFYTEEARLALDDHAGEFRVALVHSAEVADDADKAGYALYLCGHTHGGQICLPSGRPLVTHLRRCQHAASGLWRQGRMTGYTSDGLGVSSLPLRFNTRGEVAVITLRRSSGS
jgi:predicted MPP superfamily phosphohydrolase